MHRLAYTHEQLLQMSLSNESVVRLKTLRCHCSCTARSSFFLSVIWNSLPSDVVDFSSVASFKHSINKVDFSKYLVD